LSNDKCIMWHNGLIILEYVWLMMSSYIYMPFKTAGFFYYPYLICGCRCQIYWFFL